MNVVSIASLGPFACHMVSVTTQQEVLMNTLFFPGGSWAGRQLFDILRIMNRLIRSAKRGL